MLAGNAPDYPELNNILRYPESHSDVTDVRNVGHEFTVRDTSAQPPSLSGNRGVKLKDNDASNPQGGYRIQDKDGNYLSTSLLVKENGVVYTTEELNTILDKLDSI